MFQNEMEFYHFLSPRDSFTGQVSGWVEAPPAHRPTRAHPGRHSPVVRLPPPQIAVDGKGELQ